MTDMLIIQALAAIIGSCIIGAFLVRLSYDGVSDHWDEDSEVFHG